MDDFKIAEGKKLNVKPQATYYNTSVEVCATMCSYLESFVCRSFDYFVVTNDCFLYKENIKDKIHSNIELVDNAISNHYSSNFYLTIFKIKTRKKD